MDAFASRYLQGFSREKLCRCLGVDLSTATRALQRGFASSAATVGGKRKRKPKADKPKGAKSPKKQLPRTPGCSKKLFWDIVWQSLMDLGWHLDHGNRPTDFYACPPGVSRGKGFTPRVDFFDSRLQIMDFLKKSPMWSTLPQVKDAVREYHLCVELHEKLRAAKKLPKFASSDDMVRWLRDHLQESN